MAELVLRANSRNELLDLCRTELSAAGWFVEMPRDPETVGQFCARVGISRQTLKRRLFSPWSPYVRVTWGNGMQTLCRLDPTIARGRIRAIESTPRFDHFAQHGRGCSQKTAAKCPVASSSACPGAAEAAVFQ